jgi:hypothetical protein
MSQAKSLRYSEPREDFSEYVAHLQMHMALQAKNLVPTQFQSPSHSQQQHQSQGEPSRQQLLLETQADFEKFASRQMG